MTEREALKLALEAFQVIEPHTFPGSDAERLSRAAMVAAEKVLAQPEQEPVAYGMWDTMLGKGHRMMMVRLDKGQDGCTVPLYTPPPQRTWVGLTDEEIDDIYMGAGKHDLIRARAIEAKLRSKNT